MPADDQEILQHFHENIETKIRRKTAAFKQIAYQKTQTKHRGLRGGCAVLVELEDAGLLCVKRARMCLKHQHLQQQQ